MSRPQPEIVSEALVEWITGSDVPYPTTDDAQVITKYGDSVAAELLPVLRGLEEECLGLDARHRAVELGEIAALVSAKIRERHPELTDDAVKALTNLYAWTVK